MSINTDIAGYCVQVRTDRNWKRVSPVYATEGEADHAMPKYAKSIGRLAIRTAPFIKGEEVKKAAGKIVSITRSYVDNSGNLFDKLIDRFDLKNDAGLSRWLEVAPPAVSKIRHGILGVGPALTIKVMEKSDWSLKEVRALIDGGSNV